MTSVANLREFEDLELGVDGGNVGGDLLHHSLQLEHLGLARFEHDESGGRVLGFHLQSAQNPQAGRKDGAAKEQPLAPPEQGS